MLFNILIYIICGIVGFLVIGLIIFTIKEIVSCIKRTNKRIGG